MMVNNKNEDVMNSRKILFILNNVNGGGAERIFINIANGFIKKGFDVHLLLGKNEGVYFNLLNVKIKVETLHAFSLWDYYRKLPKYFSKYLFTHIFTASDYVSAAVILLKKHRNYRFKVICTLHYNLPYQLSILPKANQIWLSWLNRKILIQSDQLVAVSNGVADGFKQIARRKLSNLITIYNPVFGNEIYSLAEEPILEKFIGKINLISIGRLTEQKAPLDLLYAFNLLNYVKEDIHLYILGLGPLKNEMIEFIENKNLKHYVHFLGFQINPFKFLKQADLFVLASIYEGLPTVIIEALALGINVVSTDCPSGPAEILNNEQYGWLAKMKNTKNLKEKIEIALKNPKPKKELQKRAQIFFRDPVISEYSNLLN